MRKIKPIVTRTAAELADVLGLTPADAMEFEIRYHLNSKIIDAVKKSGLTHVQIARLTRTSRTRLTALLNRNATHISTDLMLRILLSLGYRAKITFTKVQWAA
jgi:predicted XRE-type DNA-binding protein